MATASTMILDALIMTGEKGIEVTSLTSNEQTFHLRRLNAMLGGWSNERGMIYTQFETSFALTASDGTYTIGPGADFNMARPIKIINPCFIRDTDQNIDLPMEVLDADTYGRIVDKNIGDTWPQYLYYDGGMSATSTATIKLFPVPDSNMRLFINTIQPLSTFSTVSHNVALPTGYEDCIALNYAVRASHGSFQISDDLRRDAITSRAVLKRLNLSTPVLMPDYGLSGQAGSNIISGP